MEIGYKGSNYMNVVVACLVLFYVLSACNSQEKMRKIMNIHPSEYTVMPLTPNFSINTISDTLYNQYLRLSNEREFPLIGILRVDGKAYRFMGGDSLRIQSIAPLSIDSCGWIGKYSILYPGDDWEKTDYDDSKWKKGSGAWGTDGLWYLPYTCWDAPSIFVRRHFNIDKKDLESRKLYMRYVCDDSLTLYFNGDRIVDVGYTPIPKCAQLDDSIVRKLQVGHNVIAGHGRDIGGDALMDYGLYVENKTYDGVTTACLKSMDLQTTQTHYSFQCGEVELRIDFVLPSLLQHKEISNSPIGLIAYDALATDGQQHDIEICFDLDMEWIFGQIGVESSVENGWRILQGENLYLAVKERAVKSMYKDGHIILTQRLSGNIDTNDGILLFGYDEKNYLQYYGENLLPYWDKKRNKSFKELLKMAGNSIKTLKEECNATDFLFAEKLNQDIANISAEQEILFNRNFIKDHRFSMTLDEELICYGDTIGKIKGAYIYSSYLLYCGRVDWMKGLLKPVFDCCENGRWHKKFPPYDIGVFPLAIRQESVEDHSVEMAADMLMMAVAIVKAENCFDYADNHWTVLNQWGNYLEEEMKQIQIPADRLLDGGDKCVKTLLGLKAYQKLKELKIEHE